MVRHKWLDQAPNQRSACNICMLHKRQRSSCMLPKSSQIIIQMDICKNGDNLYGVAVIPYVTMCPRFVGVCGDGFVGFEVQVFDSGFTELILQVLGIVRILSAKRLKSSTRCFFI